MKHTSAQSASAVLMVYPISFGFDEQTAQTNAFQTEILLPDDTVVARATQEFTAMVDGLRAHDIFVQVFRDPDVRPKPNAVFPNNWLSMWPDGTVYMYPMATESRRIERSDDALRELEKKFEVSSVTDVSSVERRGQYLESTGVIIFDHLHKVAYACISERCNPQLFAEHAAALGYEPVVFHAYDLLGIPIYHTNVMMSVQTDTVVICVESITDQTEQDRVLTCLRQSGREIIQITHAQMAAFCGNVLELQNLRGERFLALSQSAYDAFTSTQRDQLAADKTLLPFAVPTIETVGGGSVRCMLAEIFLLRK